MLVGKDLGEVILLQSLLPTNIYGIFVDNVLGSRDKSDELAGHLCLHGVYSLDCRLEVWRAEPLN